MMIIRNAVFALGLTAVMIPAFANSGASFVTGGEEGLRLHKAQSTKSKAEVRAELQSTRSIGGYGVMGTGESGESGAFSQRHSFAFQGGKLVHSDNLAHNSPKPSIAMGALERDLYRGQQ
jgi:hypothetical protein